MEKHEPRFNWVIVIVYALLAGGVISLGVYSGVELRFHPAWAVAAIFGLLGGIAFLFHQMGEGRFWKPIAVGEWACMLITITIYSVVESHTHPAIAVASLMFLAAGVLLYLRHSDHAKPHDADQKNEWRKLGSGDGKPDSLNPSERDRAVVSRQR